MTSDSQGASMSIWSMSWASIRYGWRVSLSVALGVATATAVIVGALLVGDSMRGSLRELTIERLGRTESLIMPGTFFEADGIVEGSTPLVFFSRGAIETRQQGATGVRRAGSVQVIGCGERFWDLDVTGVRPSKLPGGNSVVLNQSAATELGVKVGDLVTVRLPVQQAVPADSPLGRRDIQTEGLPRMEVLDIIPDRGLGRFSITPSQSAPQNVYLSLATVTDVLDRDGQANMLLLDRPATNDDLEIDLSDLGLTLQRVTRTFEPPDSDPAVIYDYYSLTSSQLLLSKSVVDRVTETLGSEKVVPVLTYLANAIERVDESGNVIASVPYSTISAIDSSPPLTLDYGDGSAAQSGVVPLVINDWAAKQLDAVVGMPLRIAYYEPEVENGREIERYFDAIVAGIVPITEPATPYTRIEAATFDKPPTVYNDPNLTPSVPGVTDQASISDWDLPFALERKISGVDDTYWNQYRLTPKAYLPLDDGRKLFGSRFGHTTGLRIDAAAAGSAAQLRSQLTAALQPIAADLGWSVRPIREQQLAASRGTTPFDYLFLALSFFVILAAVMLIVMLFWLGLVQRLGQFGTLLATGWPPRRVTALARDEGFLVAAVGVAIGLVGGVCYAAVVLWALRSLWVGAVTVPFLTFHWTYTSLIVGAASGWFVAAAALIFTARALTRINVQTLLSGRDIDAQLQPPASAGKARRSGRGKWNVIVLVTAIFAVIVAAAGAAVGGQAAAGGFVGGGMMLLAAGLTAIYARLRRPRRIGEDQAQATGGSYSLGTLAARNASRHPLRSTLTIGLMATASFLIIAISAFRLEPTEQGTGGFDLVAQSAQPVYRDLSQPDVQSSIMGTDAKTLSDAVVVPMRMRLGQDASCNNLYQASQPTVLGVPDSVDAAMIGDLSQLPGFEWWATAETDDGESPWALLSRSASGTKQDPIPLILDQNTAVYSLQMLGGIGQVKSFEYGAGNEISFRVVGLLSNSLLQGKLMIGNDNFERVFEDVSGYQYFLVACDDTDRDAISDSLESRLGDVGMDVSDASAVLSGMLAVQNTYLRTFQSLGALGLLLGTIGLAVSQLRSVLERRRELAVLRAIGFTRKRLAAMVMRETASLLLAGIGCGVACAVLAVVPHAILSGLKPPLVEPIVMVIGIILFGMLAGIIAVGRVVRMPLMESLRSE